VQYFGSRHRQGEMDYKLLSPLLNITTELDPHLLVAYQFGSIFLSQAPPQGAGDPDAAAALVERGIKANPDNWRLYLNLGFIDYQQRKDYAAAQDAFERGSKVKNAHPALKVLAAEMAEHRNDTATARYLWTALYENTEDKILRENAEEHLTALQVEDEITRLEQVIEAYRQRMGRFPSSWLELNEAGYISGIPRDPTGAALRLADGHVFVQDATKIPFLGKGLPPGQQPAPRPGIQ
jgi:tetratricopeptide (TPR) repeat protein